MTTQSFASKNSVGLAFTNVTASEVDVGNVGPFVSPAYPPVENTVVVGAYQALDFSGFTAGAEGPGSSINVTLSYNVASTVAGQGISALQQSFTPDTVQGLASLVITESVYDQNNNLVGTTTTNLANVNDPAASGVYAFGDLVLTQAYASLHVVVTISAVVAPAAASTDIVAFSEIEQGFQTSAVATPPLPGSISGDVFVDNYGTGIQTGTDTTLSGILVQLLDSNGNIIVGATTTTDANGNYSFTGLAAGGYSVAFTAPNGDKFSATNARASSVDSIVNTTTGQINNIVVTAGANTPYQNAAVYAPGTITTHIYNDASDSGKLVTGDANIAGVTVDLLNNTGTAVLASAVTDANGNASFTGLTPGSYEVSAITPTGDVVTQPIVNPITVVSGGASPVSEGLFNPGSLSGHIFTDQNADGIQESGDTNLAGVTVTLLNSAGASTGATAVTGANGFYQFSNLVAGTYSVAFTAPTGDKFSTTTAGTSAVDSIVNTTTGKTSPVAVVAGATTTNQNAAVYLPGTFTEHVYLDANDNGTQDAGDTNLAGVTVTLLTGTGASTGLTAVTDANGNASFTGLTPGSYETSVTTPTGATVTGPITVGAPAPIPIASGGTGGSTEGVFIPGSLSGHIFTDQNDDGIQESGDTNLAGVTVTLLNSSGASTGATAVTDANGFYQFGNLVAGTYSVAFTAPSGDKFSATTAGTSPVDSIVNTTTGKTAPVVVAGTSIANQNAAVYVPDTITTHVYTDTNKSLGQDIGEANLSGVTVDLLNGAGTTVLASAVTDANGNVSFTGLVPGSYEVAVVAPTGDTVTQHSNVGTAIPLLTGGLPTVNAIEGLYGAGSLSGRVFGDYNADGVYDTIGGTDFGLAGQTVQLLNGSGVAIAGVTATTDCNGNYSFTNLAAGTYEVQVVPVSGAKFSPVGTNSMAALASVVTSLGVSPQETVVAGQNTANVNAGEYLPATLSTHVYLDANDNSTQDCGDSNLAGVTVDLLTGTGAATGITAVTDANGNATFANLLPGTYEVAVVTPAGDTVTQSSFIGTPIVLTDGQTSSAPIEGVTPIKTGLSIVKTPSVLSTTPGIASPPLTYTFKVTNTGTTALTGVSVTDVTDGIASTAVTYTDPNALAVGATWTYTTAAVSVPTTQDTTAVIGTGHGFNLGDSLTYGIIAFHAGAFSETSSSPVIGNVGVGAYGSLKIGGGGISGDLETTGALPGSSGCVTDSSTTGISTAYGTAGWAANWGNETATANCYSNFGCSGSTGSAVWDDFWSQCTTASVCPIVLNVSEDAWQGNAQFTVFIDGKQIGGVYTATACHSSGQSQAFNLGNFAAGAHTVSVDFINDAYGGTSNTDRNLYVNSISDNGCMTAGSTQLSGGTVNYAANAGAVQTTEDITLNTSEDYWQGNAQFTVSVDGQQIGGTYTTTAIHGSGQNQAFDLGQFALGAHAVTVTFINDAYGGTCSTDRNLYVNSITADGVTTSGAAQDSNGSVTYTTTAGCVGGDNSDDSWGNLLNGSGSVFNSSYSGGAYGQIGNSTTLAADIASLTALSTSLFAEAGTTVSLCSGTDLMATSGKLDASGNEVFTVTNWSNNFTVTGNGSNTVVLNVSAGVSINLGQLNLEGGITANQVMINYEGTNTVTDTNYGTTTNATILAPNAGFNLASGTLNGHVLGGASGQAFTIGSGATVEAPPLTAYTLTDTATATGSANGITATANASASVVVNPESAGVSQGCNAPSSGDNLCNDYGQLQKLELCWNPGTSVNTNSGSCGISAGSCNTGSSSPCFITITDSSSDSTSGCNNFFEGSVTAGEKILADASSLWNGAAGPGCFSPTANAMLFVHCFTSQSAYQAGQSACQEMAYDTSGAHGISLGDQVGCITVAGYVSTSGQGYIS